MKSRSRWRIPRIRSLLPSGASCVVYGSFCLGVCWLIACSVILLLVAVFYEGAIEEESNQFAEIVADRVRVQAANTFSAALAARDALDHAVRRGLYSEPLEYDGVANALRPVLAAWPALRAVELAFTNRGETITVKRLPGSRSLMVQSDAANCLTALGPAGCRAGVPASTQPWYYTAISLPCVEACDGREAAHATDTFQWLSSAGFAPEEAIADHAPDASAGGQSRLSIVPVYSLVFKSPFPGTDGSASVVGRAVLDLRGLVDEALPSDETLGSRGGAFICNSVGDLLAARSLEEQCVIENTAEAGNIRLRRVWELGDDWAKSLQASDFATCKNSAVDEVHIVIKPLAEPSLAHFRVVVASEQGEVAHAGFTELSFFCKAMAGLPYVALVVLVLPVYINKRYRQWTAHGMMRMQSLKEWRPRKRHRKGKERPSEHRMNGSIGGFNRFRMALRRGSFSHLSPAEEKEAQYHLAKIQKARHKAVAMGQPHHRSSIASIASQNESEQRWDPTQSR